jgi:hypothetical protein
METTPSRQSAAHAGIADLPYSPLHRRGEELPDDRVRVHRGEAPLGDDGGVDEEGAGEARVCHAGGAPGHRQVKANLNCVYPPGHVAGLVSEEGTKDAISG